MHPTGNNDLQNGTSYAGDRWDQRNRGEQPISRSSSSNGSKKRQERSPPREKTSSLSPHNLMHREEGEIKERGSAEKKRFRVLNSLERKGLAQKQKELEQQQDRHPTDAVQLELEKARRQELESCYQITKDAFNKSKEDLKRSQADKKRLRNELDKQDARLARLQKDLHEALEGKRKAEDDKDSYRNSYHDKKKELERAESDLKFAEERYKKKLKETEQEWEKKMGECQGQLDKANEALAYLRTEKQELQSATEQQERCLEAIERLLQTYRSEVLTPLI